MGDFRGILGPSGLKIRIRAGSGFWHVKTSGSGTLGLYQNREKPFGLSGLGLLDQALINALFRCTKIFEFLVQKLVFSALTFRGKN